MENELLSDKQKKALSEFDTEAKNSRNRWKRRIKRRLRDEEYDILDASQFMLLPGNVRLAAYYGDIDPDGMLDEEPCIADDILAEFVHEEGR